MGAGWLKEQIGPLPAGAWVAVVGGGLGLAWYSRRHPAPPATVDGPPSADLGPTGVIDNSTATGSGAGSTPTTPPIVSNEDWARIAGATLIAHGYDPLLVTGAIAKYLAGQSLSDRETAAIQLALQLVGPPPLAPPPPAPTDSGPTDPTPNAPVVPVVASGSGFFSGPQAQLNDILKRNAPPASGYPALVKGNDGATYEWLSPTAETPVAKSGQDVYVQAAPGDFIDIGPWSETGGLIPGTPIYLRVS